MCNDFVVGANGAINPNIELVPTNLLILPNNAGTAVINGTNITFTPDPNYIGQVIIMYIPKRADNNNSCTEGGYTPIFLGAE